MTQTTFLALSNFEELDTEIQIKRSSISPDRMDISFGELINLYKNKELIIRPEYQRFYRWSKEQKTAFIESLLLGIPVPPIFVSEDENGIWELVDGLQRTATFISFFGELDKEFLGKIQYQNQTISILNNWKLERGNLLEKIEGLDIENLPSKYKLNLKRATCRVEILRGASQVDMKYELFKRLNAGGAILTPQEIRNAVYRNVNSKLNIALSKLTKNESFIKLINLTEQKKLELYDEELVLKFMAFLNQKENINDSTERFLNNFMQNAIKNKEFDFEYYENLFIKTLNLIEKLNDDKVFRTLSTNNTFVPAYFEAIMICVAENFDYFSKNITILEKKIVELKHDNLFKKLSGSASSSKSRTKQRLNRASEIFSSH